MEKILGNPNAKPPVEYQFKPGGVGNPNGRPQVPADIREARKISQFEFERIVNKYLFMDDSEFEADLARPNATKFERLVGGIIDKAIKKKDERKAEWILARTLGKMRERLEVSSKSLRVNVTASQGALPSIEQLALENPDLTPAQLESFSEKLTKLREEITVGNRGFQDQVEKTLEIEATPLPTPPDE